MLSDTEKEAMGGGGGLGAKLFEEFDLSGNEVDEIIEHERLLKESNRQIMYNNLTPQLANVAGNFFGPLGAGIVFFGMTAFEDEILNHFNK